MKNLDIDEKKIRSFCDRWKVKDFRIFGSAVREDFRPESDVDVLVDFDKDARWTLLDLSDMRDELEDIFGREVDIITKRGLESSENYLRRRSILSNARVIYAER